MKKNQHKINYIFGVNVFPLTYLSAINTIKQWIKKSERNYVCVAAVHLIMECQNDPFLLSGINKSGLVTSDGMPLVWILKSRGFKNIERVYGPTLMEKICKLAEEKKYKIYILGGSRGQSKQVRDNLKSKYPNLVIVGNQDTPNKSIEEKQETKLIEDINNSKAQIVFVGIGCPYQELWMINNRKYLEANVLIGVGAAFDFITGKEKQAPKWVQNLGLEWLFRFIQNPFRLWHRYIILNFQFIGKIILEDIKHYFLRKD